MNGSLIILTVNCFVERIFSLESFGRFLPSVNEMLSRGGLAETWWVGASVSKAGNGETRAYGVEVAERVVFALGGKGVVIHGA